MKGSLVKKRKSPLKFEITTSPNDRIIRFLWVRKTQHKKTQHKKTQHRKLNTKSQHI